MLDVQDLKACRAALEDGAKDAREIREYDANEGEMGDIPDLVREVGDSISSPVFIAVAPFRFEAKRNEVGTGNVVEYGGCSELPKD